jgi:hypothetical protein
MTEVCSILITDGSSECGVYPTFLANKGGGGDPVEKTKCFVAVT